MLPAAHAFLGCLSVHLHWLPPAAALPPIHSRAVAGQVSTLPEPQCPYLQQDEEKETVSKGWVHFNCLSMSRGPLACDPEQDLSLGGQHTIVRKKVTFRTFRISWILGSSSTIEPECPHDISQLGWVGAVPAIQIKALHLATAPPTLIAPHS